MRKLLSMYGQDYLNKLPRPYIYTTKGGVHPEAAAELFGFDSADAMIKALRKAISLREKIKAEVTKRMRAEYGDPMLDGFASSVAMDAIFSTESREKLLHAELQALRDKQRAAAPALTSSRAA